MHNLILHSLGVTFRCKESLVVLITIYHAFLKFQISMLSVTFAFGFFATVTICIGLLNISDLEVGSGVLTTVHFHTVN